MTATMTIGERRPAETRWPVLCMLGGLAVAAAAVVPLALHLVDREESAAGPAVAAAAVFPDVGVTGSSYQPGHTSGWHVHPGVHSVAVLAGTLTVYDESCARSEYGPGQTYLGGAAPHLARNERSEVLDVAITYVYRPAAGDHGSTVTPPRGCDIR